MFDEHAVFRLTKALPDGSVCAGAVGVVLMVFISSSGGYAYLVEFPDDVGGNLGDQITYTLSEDFMAPVSSIST
jgi:hypothetical protein